MEAAKVKAGVDLGRVRAALEPVLSAHAVDLVELEWTTDRTGWMLRLTIERVGGVVAPDQAFGVTLADCAEVSRDASQVLDVEDLIAQHYRLEVSSPGLDRPLKSEADFSRFSGRLAKVKLARPASDGQRVLRGTLESAPASRVAILADGRRVEFPFADIAEANLVFELNPQPKKGAKKGEKPKKTTKA